MDNAPIIENPDLKRWRRRAITIPTGLILALLSTPIILLLIPFALIWDALDKQKSITRALLFFYLFFWLQSLGLLKLGWSWTSWIFHRNRGRFLESNHRIQLWWATTLFKSMTSLMKMRFTIEGDTPNCGNSLIFVRHASVADTVLPIGLVSLPQDLRVRYVLKAELKWDPCLDVAGQRLPNAFVKRGAGATEIERTARLADNLNSRSAVVIYPEGTRFTEKRREALIERFSIKGDRLNESRARAFKRSLPPRIGGVSALMARAPDAPIIIMGHHGFEGATKLSNLFNGTLKGSEVCVRFWVAPALGDDDIGKWLDDRWRILDDWLTSKQNSATINPSN